MPRPSDEIEEPLAKWNNPHFAPTPPYFVFRIYRPDWGEEGLWVAMMKGDEEANVGYEQLSDPNSHSAG